MKTVMRISIGAVGAAAVAAFLVTSVRADPCPNGWLTECAVGEIAVAFQNEIKIYANDVNVDDPKQTIPLSGVNRALAFDAGLVLHITNTSATGAGTIQKLFPPSGATSDSVETQGNPRAITFAADGTYYVGSMACTGTGSSRSCEATIRRFPTSFAPADLKLSVGSSASCVGFDLDPDQKTLYVVAGEDKSAERKIHTLDVSTKDPGADINLPGSGAACGIRVERPRRNQGNSLSNRTFVVADRNDVKRVNSSGQLIEGPFTASVDGNARKNWIDVELEADGFHIVAIDDGKAINENNGESLLARFQLNPDINMPDADADPAPPACDTCGVLVNFGSARPLGVTENGALRSAQAVQFVEWVQQPTGSQDAFRGTATFLQNTTSDYSWIGLADEAPPPMAIMAQERRSTDGVVVPSAEDGDLCPPGLDIACRLYRFRYDNNTKVPVAKKFSRNRAPVIREIPLVTSSVPYSFGIDYHNPTNILSQGQACTPGIPTQLTPYSAFLRDPFPTDPLDAEQAKHRLFTHDLSGAKFPDNDEEYGSPPPFGSDSLLVLRFDARYVAQLKKPAFNDPVQVNSTFQIAITVRDPITCAIPSDLQDLTNKLVLTATDITTGTPLNDTEGLFAPFNQNGIAWETFAGDIRTNLVAAFPVGHTIGLYISSKGNNPQKIGDLYAQITITAGKGRK